MYMYVYLYVINIYVKIYSTALFIFCHLKKQCFKWSAHTDISKIFIGSRSKLFFIQRYVIALYDSGGGLMQTLNDVCWQRQFFVKKKYWLLIKILKPIYFDSGLLINDNDLNLIDARFNQLFFVFFYKLVLKFSSGQVCWSLICLWMFWSLN